MQGKRPTLRRLLTAVAAICCLSVLTAVTPASADKAPDSQAYAKYYLVAARYQGQPENLTEIAVRFLGSAARSADIYNLNTGRIQPDGAGLADPAKLHAGWYLVLPWDAVGPGVKYGQIPSGPAPRATPSRPRVTPRPRTTPGPRGTTKAPVRPTPTRSGTAAPSPAGSCTARAASSNPSTWAQLRLAVDGAWDVSRGNGVMVAVVDSGVDGALTQLAGRITVGADVTVGNGRGDSDCLGTGTAMASIIAANAGAEKNPVGMAPDATILPIRMVGSSATARATDAANAIEVAVSAGASVLALGEYVDLSAPEVVTSLSTALDHDVVVVAPAPLRPITLPKAGQPSATGALLLVGGVDADNKPIERYQPDTVEVVAPGANVASIGPGKTGTLSYTGTRYAVAFVAGEAALVRAAYPELPAVKVEERITTTVDASAGGDAGMIDPAASVARPDDEARPVSSDAAPGAEPVAGGSGGSGKRGAAAVVCLGVVLIAGGGIVIARMLRRRATG